jgi:hypothetical protein
VATNGTLTSNPVTVTIQVDAVVVVTPTGGPPVDSNPDPVEKIDLPASPPPLVGSVDAPVTPISGNDVVVTNSEHVVTVSHQVAPTATITQPLFTSLGEVTVGVVAVPIASPRPVPGLPASIAVPALPASPMIPTPPSLATTVQQTPGPILVPPPMVGELPATRPILPAASEEQLIRGLDELDHEVAVAGTGRATAEVAVASGFVATAGYVLLNPRLALWFLGALAARRAVWKPFDPLDVIYAWEQEGGAKDEDAEDELTPMFGK